MKIALMMIDSGVAAYALAEDERSKAFAPGATYDCGEAFWTDDHGGKIILTRTELTISAGKIVGVGDGAVVGKEALEDARDWCVELRAEREGLRGTNAKNTRRLEQLDNTIAALDAALKDD